MRAQEETPRRARKPHWLTRRLPTGHEYEEIRSLIRDRDLHTVCQEARCPNQWECFSRRTATFLILGSRCTRRCLFCAVGQGLPELPDPGEPSRVADTASRLGLRYVVITSVTRDDLSDGGAGIFADTIREVRHVLPGAIVEVLIPDFLGDEGALRTVLAARPDVLNHNVETVPRLYPLVRSAGNYSRSLELLARTRDFNPSIPTKSGLMLGLGESPEELGRVLSDLRNVGCGILTLGQYLQPSKANLEVARYIPPEEFDRWREISLTMGFTRVASGPFVRSSYHAGELYGAAPH